MEETALITARSQEDVARSTAIVRSVADAIVTIDPRGAIDSLNPSAEELFGFIAEEATGRAFAALLGEPFQEEYAGHMRAHARGETIAVIGRDREVVGRRSDGTTFAMDLRLTDLRPMEQRMLVAVARDIGDRKRAEAQLRQLADHDPVTGLLTRRCFENELTRHVEYAARYGSAGSLVALDIDNFSHINEELGLEAGDELVKGVAELIRARVRRTDVLGRLGGDQLGVLLHGAGRAKALGVAQELVELVREHPFVIDRQPVRVTVSGGVAAIEDRPVTGSVLLSEAEAATDEAKSEGRDRVVDYSPEGHEETDERVLWSERVRQATESGLFVIVSQPIVELAGGGITQHELLLRMRGEDGELILPGNFLSTAEHFGLIGAVDRWVTRQAVRLIAAHRDAGNSVTVEVNLSDMTLADTNFAAELANLLETTGIDPSLLVFEVSETAAVADIERARGMAGELTSLGCRFALDDFGAGFASLYHLKHLPLSYLKIDGEFVRELPSSGSDQLVVKALVDVCRGLGIKTIAESVEDEASLAMLRDLGVDYAQGFFLGHPHPVSDLAGPPSGEARSAYSPLDESVG
ncbi:MAG TPA: EAL domain-containing protein [Solirubrobacterales bacterium]|nr:EAL domain-containing protein [Solirubrobacterales bacterium]